MEVARRNSNVHMDKPHDDDDDDNDDDEVLGNY